MKTNFANNVVMAAKRAAFLLSLLLVVVISLSCLVVCIPPFLLLCDVLGITGTVQFICALIFILGPVLELTINVESNALAVVNRIFPRFFPCRMSFQCFSFWHRIFTHKPLL